MKFTIPGQLPAMNEIIKKSKSHYMAYSTMKKTNTELVAWSAKGLKPVKRADFVITHYCKNKRKDPDNVQGGATKFILDGLVASNILENDGWKQIGDITHIMKVDKANPRIEVQIKEVT